MPNHHQSDSAVLLSLLLEYPTPTTEGLDDKANLILFIFRFLGF